MELNTTGANANSWVDLDAANLILLEVPHSVVGYEPTDPKNTDAFQLESEDIPYIIEAHRQISQLWKYRGVPVDVRQRLAWPRRGFTIAGPAPGEGWFGATFPGMDPAAEPFARFIHFAAPGLSTQTTLADDEIPEDIKEAAVILAALLKNGQSLYGDNKGDETAYSLGSISGDNINAVAVAAGVFQRMARWGLFIGGSIVKAGGSRG